MAGRYDGGSPLDVLQRPESAFEVPVQVGRHETRGLTQRSRVGRRDDIPILVEHFVQKHRQRTGKRIDGVAPDVIQALQRYDWPGNVRELKNALERALVLCRGSEIDVADLPEEVARGEALVQKASNDGHDHGLSEKDFREAKRKFEVAYLTKQLTDHRWNVSRTAATIGLHRQSLQEKLRELGIRRPGHEPPEEE